MLRKLIGSFELDGAAMQLPLVKLELGQSTEFTPFKFGLPGGCFYLQEPVAVLRLSPEFSDAQCRSDEVTISGFEAWYLALL